MKRARTSVPAERDVIDLTDPADGEPSGDLVILGTRGPARAVGATPSPKARRVARRGNAGVGGLLQQQEEQQQQPDATSGSSSVSAPIQVPIRCFRQAGFASGAEVAARQNLVKMEKKGQVLSEVCNSPYGKARASLGWGDVYGSNPAKAAAFPGRVHIGLSSLHATPSPGPGSSRDMKVLMQQFSRKFSCLEHCATYHKIHEESTWRAWQGMAKAAGKGFRLSVKMPKSVTHDGGLALTDEVRSQLEGFLERARLLRPHLGPILVQLPPTFKKGDEAIEKLEALAEFLPRDLQFAFEFRSPSMFCDSVYEVMRNYNFITVVYHLLDAKQDFTTPFVDTCSDTVYIRLHGALEQFHGDYGPSEMLQWSNFVRAILQRNPRKQVYFFFNNNESFVSRGPSSRLVSSVVDATQLARFLSKAQPVEG